MKIISMSRLGRVLAFTIVAFLSASQASAALLGLTALQTPTVSLTNAGTVSYSASSRLLFAALAPDTLRLPGGVQKAVYPTQDAASERFVRVKLIVNAGGTSVSSDPSGPDLEFRGAVDLNGNAAVDPGESGVLLTGEIVSFGYLDTGTSNDRFEFRFRVTGGSLASMYGGKDIGVILTPESSSFVGTFDSNFATTFTKGSLGSISTLCVDLSKQVSLNGVDWFDADTPDAPDVPMAAVPADAHYRMIATNCGTGQLVDVTVTDDMLGLSYVIGDLAPGASQTVSEGQASALFVPGRCDHAGTLINSAQVTGKNSSRGESRTAADDAVIKCTTTPEIDLKKQISVDGGATWFDADTEGTAPVVTAPHGAEYRFIVTNIGTADLAAVTISDATLDITDYPVGDLAAGQSVIIGSGEIPAAAVAERCANPGKFTNTASTFGRSVDGDALVNDSDVAVLVCAGEPGIDVVKEISVDGGVTWADANAAGDADTPTVPFPHGAEYRFIVRNIGQAALTNVSVEDADLGVVYAIPGTLPVGGEVIVGSGDVGGALTIATRCSSSGTLINVVSVTGESVDTGEAVTDSDPAVINCVGTPGIKLRKQISLNGVDWADADTADAADTPSAEAPADAHYRFLVSNVGNVDLENVTVIDPTIAISHTIGNLAVGESVVVDSGVIPNGLLVVDRCTSAGDFVNVAEVTGDAVDTGTPVGDTDPAVLKCTTPPPSECGCEGKVTTLTLKYTGDAMAYVKVKQVKDWAVVYEGYVMPGDTFTFTGTWKNGTLGTEIKILVDGEYHAKIHTSCSKPIGPGLVAGDFEVVDGASKYFPALCPVDQPPDDGGKGCTPGYWRQVQHYGNWTDYNPDTPFGSVFEDAFPGKSLGEVVQLGGGGLEALGRHTVAALLNAASSSVDFGMTPAQVVDAFNAVYPGADGDYEALKNQFAAMNERGCPLGRACKPKDDGHDKGDRCDKKHKKGDRCDKDHGDKGDRCDKKHKKGDRCDKDHGDKGGHDKGDRCDKKHKKGDRCDKDHGDKGGHDKGDRCDKKHKKGDRCDKDHGDKGGHDKGDRCDKKHKKGDRCDKDHGDKGGHDKGGKGGHDKGGKSGHDKGDHSRCDHPKGDKGGKSGHDKGGKSGHDKGGKSGHDKGGKSGHDKGSKSGDSRKGGDRSRHG